MPQEATKVKKRDGRLVSFNQEKITQAIFKALTITGQGDEKTAQKLSDKVVKVVNRRFKKAEIPEVEQIQDIIEEVLMLEDLVETARSYILYREQRRRIREADQIYDEAVEILDKYIDEMDWEVKENSNMAYSLQGLNNYGVSTLTKRYWLNKIYPKQIREAFQSGDFHIHDLDILATYCCGWDLYDLLKRGFGGVPGKVEAKPPKHLRVALGQVVNFMYTLQAESAGAQALSSLDTLLAPFIRYDNLDYPQVKQAMQEFLFNCAIPTRVGFQCLSEDTEILTPNGWRRHNEVKDGDFIKTFNIKRGHIEEKEVKSVFRKEYDGIMYNLKTEKQDQLISPGHKMVIKKSGGSFFVQPVEEVVKSVSPVSIPVISQEEEIIIEEISPKAIQEIDYQGIIWCPNTENETVIAKRKGQVFITGNTPFTNVTLDIEPHKSYVKQPVIIGGELQKETYGEFHEEMKIFNKAFYESMMEGDKNGRIFTFPIPTINITKDFPWDEPILEPMWQATAKYGVNYFANFIQSDMTPEDARSMCCRLRLDNRELYKRGGGLFGAHPKTGSIGVVTVNLPRLGYLSKTKKEFFQRLDRIMDLAKESLEIKRSALDDFMTKGLYPYSKYYLEGVDKMRGSYYGNHFSTIGLLGMNECLLNFMGEDIAAESGKKFALEVLDYMRERIKKYQEQTGNLYNLEATPAEGASYKLCLKDKALYPNIITAGTKEVPYYTNSSQLPVDFTDDIFEALELQDELQCKYTGGTTIHLFLGERIQDVESIKALIKKIFTNFRLPYLTFTPTFSVCPIHGYLSGEHWLCPKCTIEQKCEVYSRIVGYIRPLSQWHEGKAQEFKDRKVFKFE